VITLLRRSASQARYVVLWGLALLCAFQLILIAQAVEIQRTQSFSRMADLLPAFFQRGMGSKAMLLATFKGTVAFGYFHPVACLLVVVIAIYVMTEPAHEVESGLVDLELARAVPRHRLLTRTVLLAAGTVAGLAGVMFLGTYLGSRIFDTGGLDMPSLEVRVQLLAHLAAVAACCGGFGLLLATCSRRWMTAFTTASLTTVVMYLVDFLAIGWRPMRAFAWMSPFHYYPALSIIAGDAPPARNLAVLLASAAIFIAAAYWQFQRRDL
jgi:ABC-type transport system involved in multi-copper enzyme maturation permease subunit